MGYARKAQISLQETPYYHCIGRCHDDHVKILDKKITELSDALAHLGKSTDLKELLRIIRFPGWTTPA